MAHLTQLTNLAARAQQAPAFFVQRPARMSATPTITVISRWCRMGIYCSALQNSTPTPKMLYAA